MCPEKYSIDCIADTRLQLLDCVSSQTERRHIVPRGQYKRKSKVDLNAGVSSDVQMLVSPDAFNTLAWWEKLKQEEQTVVVHEGRLLAQAMLDHGKSRLAIGEHLEKLQAVLEPHNLFGKFLKNYHFSKRTAYRYIAGFKNAKARLPETVLKAAMARGVDIIGDTETKPLGKYTDAVAKLPVPKEATEIQANTYLNQLEQVRKETASSAGQMFSVPVPQDPQTLLKECYRFVSLRYKRLPTGGKVRQRWVQSLVGMILADLGVSGQQTFVPQAAPESFQAQRGRPTLAVASA
jgi:hypothetical protein